MTRYQYYEELKSLARKLRSDFELSTHRVLISHLRKIYKHYGIKIDLWPRPGVPSSIKLKGLRGAFFRDEYGTSVLVNRHLPLSPRV